MAKRGRPAKTAREVYEEVPRHLMIGLEAMWRFQRRPGDWYRDLTMATTQLCQAAGDAARWKASTEAAKPPDMRRGRVAERDMAWPYLPEAEWRARAALAAWANGDAGRCAQMARQAYAWALKARRYEAWCSWQERQAG